MKKFMDKLREIIKCNKKLIIFLVVVSIVALVFGSIFTVMLNSNDKQLITEYINNFMNNLSGNNLNYVGALKNGFASYLTFIIIIWLLGISVVGMPIILFMYFSKIFVLGFSISAIISNYGIKGCLLSFAYIFPHQIINLIVYTILTLYSLKVAGKIMYCIIKKQKLDFKIILHNYSYVLLGTIVSSILMILLEVYITPKFISIFLPLIG